MSDRLSRHPGHVYLVGAGPGDPELLTLKALRLLRAADVVLHDELVSPAIVKLASSHVQIHNVGKRCRAKKMSQNDINALMVNCALDGLEVVRLKGGDPMIFGRADEEIAALRSAGIQFEVVPGITAVLGAAAAAQVPLTQRYLSSSLVLTTYHRAANQPRIDWQRVVACGTTIALYMPGGDYREISRVLSEAGLSGETPCVVASRATTTQEVLATTTLDRLPEVGLLAAPTLLIIGAVGHSAATSTLEPVSAEPVGKDQPVGAKF